MTSIARFLSKSTRYEIPITRPSETILVTCHPKHPRHFLNLWLRHRAHATITRFRRFRLFRARSTEITTLILVLVVRLVSRKVFDGWWPRKNSASRRAARLVTALLSPCARWRGRDYASDYGAVIGRISFRAVVRSAVRRSERIGPAVWAGPRVAPRSRDQ